jgi:hypothetical protein
MSTIQYLLDEHVGTALLKMLKQQVPDIVAWRIGDPGTPMLGTADPDILKWCETHSFILITNNRATMPEHLKNHLASGRHIRYFYTQFQDGTYRDSKRANTDTGCFLSRRVRRYNLVSSYPIALFLGIVQQEL